MNDFQQAAEQAAYGLVEGSPDYADFLNFIEVRGKVLEELFPTLRNPRIPDARLLWLLWQNEGKRLAETDETFRNRMHKWRYRMSGLSPLEAAAVAADMVGYPGLPPKLFPGNIYRKKCGGMSEDGSKTGRMLWMLRGALEERERNFLKDAKCPDAVAVSWPEEGHPWLLAGKSSLYRLGNDEIVLIMRDVQLTNRREPDLLNELTKLQLAAETASAQARGLNVRYVFYMHTDIRLDAGSDFCRTRFVREYLKDLQPAMNRVMDVGGRFWTAVTNGESWNPGERPQPAPLSEKKMEELLARRASLEKLFVLFTLAQDRYEEEKKNFLAEIMRSCRGQIPKNLFDSNSGSPMSVSVRKTINIGAATEAVDSLTNKKLRKKIIRQSEELDEKVCMNFIEQHPELKSVVLKQMETENISPYKELLDIDAYRENIGDVPTNSTIVLSRARSMAGKKIYQEEVNKLQNELQDIFGTQDTSAMDDGDLPPSLLDEAPI